MSRWYWGLFALSIGVSLLLDFIVVGDQHRPDVWGAEVRGSFAIGGALAAALLIVVSRWLGDRLLGRGETYYEGDGGDE